MSSAGVTACLLVERMLRDDESRLTYDVLGNVVCRKVELAMASVVAILGDAGDKLHVLLTEDAVLSERGRVAGQLRVGPEILLLT